MLCSREEKKIFDYIQQYGTEDTLYNKPCKYLMLGNRKLYAYFVECDYIVGQDENGYILDTQQEKALFLKGDE